MATGKPKKHFAHDRVSSRIFQSNTPNPKITFTNAGDQWETTAVTVDFEAFSTLLSETGMNWKCGIGMLTSAPHHTVISRFTSAASSFMSTHKWQQSNLEQKLALSEIDRTSQGKNTWVIIMETAAGTHTCKRLRTHTCKPFCRMLTHVYHWPHKKRANLNISFDLIRKKLVSLRCTGI